MKEPNNDVTGQRKRNMQFYMSSYSTGDIYPREKTLEDNFKGFVDSLVIFIYQKYAQLAIKSDYKSLAGNSSFLKISQDFANNFDLNAEYLANVNDEILNRPNFLNGENEKKLNDSNYKHATSTSNANFDISVSYIAGVDDDEPNKIRVNFKDNIIGGFITGNIDFCSNNEIVIGDFIKHSSYDESKLELLKIESDFQEKLAEAEECCMQIFNKANLNTKNSHMHM